MNLIARLTTLEQRVPPAPTVIPLPPAVAAYFAAHGARRPVWDGYRLGRPLPPEGTALRDVYRRCEDAACYGVPVAVWLIQRSLLVHGYIRRVYRARWADWQGASSAVFGVDHDTVTQGLWTRPAAMLQAWRRQPHDAATLAAMGFGVPELVLLDAESDVSAEAETEERFG